MVESEPPFRPAPMTECIECGSKRIESHDYDDGSTEYACRDCGYYITAFPAP